MTKTELGGTAERICGYGNVGPVKETALNSHCS